MSDQKRDVNQESFELQQKLVDKKENVNEIRRQVENIRSLSYCIEHKLVPTYFPWKTGERYQRFTDLLQEDKKENLVERWNFYEEVGLNGHGDQIDISTILEHGFVTLYILPDPKDPEDPEAAEPSYIVYTVGLTYWDPTQPEIWGMLPVQHVRTFSRNILRWMAAGKPSSEFTFSKDQKTYACTRELTDQEKAGTMGYAVWFYINYADTDIRNVPFRMLSEVQADAT